MLTMKFDAPFRCNIYRNGGRSLSGLSGEAILTIASQRSGPLCDQRSVDVFWKKVVRTYLDECVVIGSQDLEASSNVEVLKPDKIFRTFARPGLDSIAESLFQVVVNEWREMFPEGVEGEPVAVAVDDSTAEAEYSIL